MLRKGLEALKGQKKGKISEILTQLNCVKDLISNLVPAEIVSDMIWLVSEDGAELCSHV